MRTPFVGHRELCSLASRYTRFKRLHERTFRGTPQSRELLRSNTCRFRIFWWSWYCSDRHEIDSQPPRVHPYLSKGSLPIKSEHLPFKKIPNFDLLGPLTTVPTTEECARLLRFLSAEFFSLLVWLLLRWKFIQPFRDATGTFRKITSLHRVRVGGSEPVAVV